MKPTQRFRFFYRCLIISLFFLLASCYRQPDAYDIFDQPIFLDEFKGKWILLNYWATWCEACQEEIPILNQFTQKYGTQAVVLAIHYGPLSKDKLQDFAKTHHMEYRILMTDIHARFGIQDIPTVLPTLFVISPQGDVIHTLYGEQTPEDLLSAIRNQ